MGDPGISVFEELNIQAEEKIETLLSSFQVNKRVLYMLNLNTDVDAN
jgi:hypothetical protein